MNLSLQRTSRWLLIPLALVACLAVGVADDKPAAPKERTDFYKDALPPGAIARLGSARYRADATSVAYSADGKLLAAGAADNQIHLFDAETGKELRRLTGHQARTYQAPRDLKGGTDLLISSTGAGNVTCLAFSPDNKTLVSGGWDDCLRFWNVETGDEIRRVVAHKAMVSAVAWSTDGKTIASRGGLDGIVRLWNPETGAETRKFEGLAKINPWRLNRDTALAIAPNNKYVAVGDAKVIHLFDVKTGKEAQTLEGGHRLCVTVTFSRDGKLLASGGIDDGKDQHSIRLWDLETGKETLQCELPKNEPPINLAFTKDGTKLAAVIEEDDLHIFDAKTGKPLHRLKHYWASRIALSPDGKTLISARGPVLRHWDPETGKELHLDFAGHQSGVTAVALAADGKLTATGASDGIRLWETQTGKFVRAIEIKGGVAALAFAPDGKTLTSAGRDRIVHIWDVDNGKSVTKIEGHQHQLCGLAISHDGKILATGDVQATIRISAVEDAKSLHVIENQTGTESLSFAFSPDDKLLVCGGAWNDTSFLPPGGINVQGIMMTRKEGYKLLVYDTKTGKEVRKLDGLEDKVKSVAFSPDGKLIAASSKDGKLCLWDAETGKEKLHIVAHPKHTDSAFSPSPGLAFEPNSKTLVSASTDNTIRLWDVTTAKEIGLRRAPDGSFTSLAFGKDGKTLVTGCADGTALVWDLTLPVPKTSDVPNVIFLQ